jgi:hypothetical protein
MSPFNSGRTRGTRGLRSQVAEAGRRPVKGRAPSSSMCVSGWAGLSGPGPYSGRPTRACPSSPGERLSMLLTCAFSQDDLPCRPDVRRVGSICVLRRFSHRRIGSICLCRCPDARRIGSIFGASPTPPTACRFHLDGKGRYLCIFSANVAHRFHIQHFAASPLGVSVPLVHPSSAASVPLPFSRIPSLPARRDGCGGYALGRIQAPRLGAPGRGGGGSCGRAIRQVA